MAGIIGLAVKGISVGIGLAGEKYHDHKTRKAALVDQEQTDTPEDTYQDEAFLEPGAETANDERIWALDEVAGDPPTYDETPPAYETADQFSDPTVSDLVQHVAETKARHVNVNTENEFSRLPYPVIIPQRRPGTKSRGWARAYAPDLEPMGIDQDTFLDFLKGWDKASQGSPWLQVVTISAGIVGLAFPTPITMAVTTAVQVAAGTAYELQGRYKANAYLDQMNKEVFMPSGLYAMVIICKDVASPNGDVEVSMETVNIENAKNISKWGLPKPDAGDNGAQQSISRKTKALRSIRMASGRANVNDVPLQIAPLVYPGLDSMASHPDVRRDENFKERLLRNKEFVADYFDRRARADFAGNNPSAALTKASSAPQEFSNRFADPNHPCNNGHLISLVTGGKIVAQPLGARRRARRARSSQDGHGESGLLGVINERARRSRSRGSKLREVGEDGKLLPKEKREERRPRGPVGFVLKGVKKVLKPDVLYLTIVNLPTEEEMAEAQAMLDVDKKGWQEIIEGMRRRLG